MLISIEKKKNPPIGQISKGGWLHLLNKIN